MNLSCPEKKWTDKNNNQIVIFINLNEKKNIKIS